MSFRQFKRFMGLVWLLTGPAAIVALVIGAFKNIDVSLDGDINQPLPWIIIIAIFTPIAVGLSIFGWYVWKGEYEGDGGQG